MEFSVFSALFGRPVGTLSWTAMVDSFEAFQVAADKINADPDYQKPDYQKMVAGAADLFEAGGQDILGQLIAATPDPPQHEWYSVTEATLDMAHAAAGIEFGVTMQAYIESTYDVSTAFFVGAVNQMGSVAWTTGLESTQHFDMVSTALSTDEKYHKMVADASGYFVAGSGTRLLNRRIG